MLTRVTLCSRWKEHHGNVPGEIAVTAALPDCFIPSPNEALQLLGCFREIEIKPGRTAVLF